MAEPRHRHPARQGARVALLALALAGAGACTPRQVVVSTGEAGPAESSIEFTNNLAQAVNVYVRPGRGAEIFLRQVPGRATEAIPVRGVAAGTAVVLRAAPVDGTVSYTQENVVLGRGVAWRVP